MLLTSSNVNGQLQLKLDYSIDHQLMPCNNHYLGNFSWPSVFPEEEPDSDGPLLGTIDDVLAYLNLPRKNYKETVVIARRGSTSGGTCWESAGSPPPALKRKKRVSFAEKPKVKLIESRLDDSEPEPAGFVEGVTVPVVNFLARVGKRQEAPASLAKSTSNPTAATTATVYNELECAAIKEITEAEVYRSPGAEVKEGKPKKPAPEDDEIVVLESVFVDAAKSSTGEALPVGWVTRESTPDYSEDTRIFRACLAQEIRESRRNSVVQELVSEDCQPERRDNRFVRFLRSLKALLTRSVKRARANF